MLLYFIWKPIKYYVVPIFKSKLGIYNFDIIWSQKYINLC